MTFGVEQPEAFEGLVEQRPYQRILACGGGGPGELLLAAALERAARAASICAGVTGAL